MPRSPIRPNIEVPFICQISYDGQGFEGFPRRCGYEIEEGGYVRPRGFDQEMLAFYQTWLYFGLMTEFFQRPIETGDLPLIKVEYFVRPSATSASPIVCSAKLTRMVHVWRRKHTSFTKHFQRRAERRFNSARDCMKLALKECVYLDQAHVIGAWHIEGAIEIMLSIKVLLNSVATAFGDLT